MLRRNRKGKFVLSPDLLTNYRRLYVDVFSIAASLSWPEELFASAAEAGVNAVFVIDAWHESHMPLARRYLELCRRYGFDCRLSEQKPAEVYAVELCETECGAGCAVVTRDYDAVKAVSLYKTARGRAVEETVADIAAVATKRVSVSRGVGWLLIEMGLRLKPCSKLRFDGDGDPHLSSRCVLTALKAKPKLILNLLP